VDAQPGLAWLGLALVVCHRYVTETKALRNLAKSRFEPRDDIRRDLDVIVIQNY
jgi:hypothetical protein